MLPYETPNPFGSDLPYRHDVPVRAAGLQPDSPPCSIRSTTARAVARQMPGHRRPPSRVSRARRRLPRRQRQRTSSQASTGSSALLDDSLRSRLARNACDFERPRPVRRASHACLLVGVQRAAFRRAVVSARPQPRLVLGLIQVTSNAGTAAFARPAQRLFIEAQTRQQAQWTRAPTGAAVRFRARNAQHFAPKGRRRRRAHETTARAATSSPAVGRQSAPVMPHSAGVHVASYVSFAGKELFIARSSRSSRTRRRPAPTR